MEEVEEMNQTELLNELSSREEVVPKCLEYWAETAGENTFIYYGESDKKFRIKNSIRLPIALAIL